MVLPAGLLLLVFTYIPLLGNVIAFLDYQPYLSIEQSPWIGLTNFQLLFDDPAFWHAVWNTVQITFLQVVFAFPVPIALAILLSSLISARIKKLVQTIVYLPHFLSWVLVVALFQQMFGGSGVVNQLLHQQGLHPVAIMTNPDTFKLLIVAQGVWKDAGWGTIIFLAALTALDDDLYESAAIDGAGWWRRLWHVTLPGIRPIIAILLILNLGQALNVGFEQILLQRSNVGPDAAEVLDTYVYFHGIGDGNFGLGAAAGLFKGVVGLILILAANKASHLLGEEGVYSRR
jgi:putative aldouronate transport system permease protein